LPGLRLIGQGGVDGLGYTQKGDGFWIEIYRFLIGAKPGKGFYRLDHLDYLGKNFTKFCSIGFGRLGPRGHLFHRGLHKGALVGTPNPWLISGQTPFFNRRGKKGLLAYRVAF